MFPCRSGLWYRHPQIHPDGAGAALRYGADRGPVQVHLPGCVRVHPDHQGQRLCLHGEKPRRKRQNTRVYSYSFVGNRLSRWDRRVVCVSRPLHSWLLLTWTEQTGSIPTVWYVIREGIVKDEHRPWERKHSTTWTGPVTWPPSLCTLPLCVCHIWHASVFFSPRRLRRSMEICSSNTSQPAGRSRSECVFLCVKLGRRRYNRICPLNLTLPPYFLFNPATESPSSALCQQFVKEEPRSGPSRFSERGRRGRGEDVL